MQQAFDFYSSSPAMGRRMVTMVTAAVGVADVEGAAVALDDLVAHGQADAAAPGLGGALYRTSALQRAAPPEECRGRSPGCAPHSTPLRVMSTSMRLPAPPCLAALSSTLQNTCFSRWGSPEIGSVYSSLPAVVVQLDAVLAEQLPDRYRWRPPAPPAGPFPPPGG